MKEGKIHIYCGDGKGKTTAAVGLAVRASGCGFRVVFVQFLKGGATGELAARVLGGEKAEDTAVLLIEDSFPVYNSEVAAQLGLSIPEDYQSAQDTAAE